MTESNVSKAGFGKNILPLVKGLLFGGAILTLGIFIIWIIEKDPGLRSVLLGLGIMLLGFYLWIAIKGLVQVPQKQEWIIELFGEYYGTLAPGLHFIIPVIVTVRSKITVGSTKVIKLFMRDDNQLDFEDDSAEMTIEIRAKTTEAKKPTYNVIFTDSEIKTIEADEIKKGNTLLPEDWMYLARIRVEAATRGVCGGLKLDDVIGAVSKEGDPNNISEKVKDIVDVLGDSYGIDVEEILVTSIKLNKDTEEKRRKLHLEEKQLLIEKVLVKQAIQKALQEEQTGVAIEKTVSAIIANDPSLTRKQAMDFLINKIAAGNVAEIKMLSGGGGDNLIATLGSFFGAGAEFGSSGSSKKKRRDEE